MVLEEEDDEKEPENEIRCRTGGKKKKRMKNDGVRRGQQSRRERERRRALVYAPQLKLDLSLVRIKIKNPLNSCPLVHILGITYLDSSLPSICFIIIGF